MRLSFSIPILSLLPLCLGLASMYAQNGSPDVEPLFPYFADTVGTSIYWHDMWTAAYVIQRKGGIMRVDPAEEKGDTNFPRISDDEYANFTSLSSNGSRLASISSVRHETLGWKATIRVHRTDTWERVFELPGDSLDINSMSPIGVVISVTGDSVLTTGTGGITCYRFSTESYSLIEITGDSLDFHPRYITADGRYVTGTIFDKDRFGRPFYNGLTTFVYDLQSGKMIRLGTGNQGPIPEPNSQYAWVDFATRDAGDSTTFFLRRVRLSDGAAEREFIMPEGTIGMVVSPTSRWLAVRRHSGTVVYDAVSGEALFSLWRGNRNTKDKHADVVFSPDERYIAAIPAELRTVHMFRIIEDETGVESQPVARAREMPCRLTSNVLLRGEQMSIAHRLVSSEFVRATLSDAAGVRIDAWNLPPSEMKSVHDIGCVPMDLSIGFYYLTIECSSGVIALPLFVKG